MLSRDANDNAIQVLHPNDAGLQRLAPTIGTAARIATAFAARTKSVGVRIRSTSGIGHIRFGDVTVAALVTDFPLNIDDGWMFFSIDALTAAGAAKTVTHVSVYAEGGTVNADIVELH